MGRAQGHLARAAGVACIAIVAACQQPGVVALPAWELAVDGAVRGQVRLPGRLESRLSDRPARYSLRAAVPVPPGLRGQALTFDIPYFAGKARAFVGGAELTSLFPGNADGYRSRGPHGWAIPSRLTQAAALDLRIDVEHSWLQSSWWQRAPRISRGARVDRETAAFDLWIRLSNGAALGAIGTIGFTTLVMFLIGRRRREDGWMAVQAALISYYPLYHFGATRVLPVGLDVPLLGLTTAWAGIALIYSTSAMLKHPDPPRAFWGLAAVNVVAALALSDPFVATRWYGRITIASVLVTIGYLARVLVAVHRRGDAPTATRTQFVAVGVISVLAMPDLLFWTDLADPLSGPRLTSVALMVYSLLQFVALGQVHIVALEQSEKQRAEIERLNEDLRRQIAERSRQLTDALARLAAADPTGSKLEVGAEVDGRYRVVGELGAGAAGVVYEVERLVDGKRLAMKVLSDVSNPRQLGRFAREAQLVAEIRHPNVVRIVDVDFSSTGYMYLVMELVEGSSLRAMRENYGDRDWACSVLRQIAAGLRALHDLGILHRDLKPANILVGRREGADTFEVKLSDFGVSRGGAPQASLDDRNDAAAGEQTETRQSLATEIEPVAGGSAMVRDEVDTGLTVRLEEAFRPPSGKMKEAEHQLTEVGTVVGTPAYMAPELVANGASSPAGDVFGFGVIAFELLCGSRPFPVSPATILLAGGTVPKALDLAATAPGLPPLLAQTLQRCVSLEPSERPTARELEELLTAEPVG